MTNLKKITIIDFHTFQGICRNAYDPFYIRFAATARKAPYKGDVIKKKI